MGGFDVGSLKDGVLYKSLVPKLILRTIPLKVTLPKENERKTNFTVTMGKQETSDGQS